MRRSTRREVKSAKVKGETERGEMGLERPNKTLDIGPVRLNARTKVESKGRR